MSRRILLTMAWRDAWRHKARSLLMLAMIALPVAGVTAADVLISTATVSATDQALVQMGTADAHLSTGTSPVAQNHDGSHTAGYEEDVPLEQATPASIRQVLGRDAEFVAVRHTETSVETDRGRVTAVFTSTAWGDPLTQGLARTVTGRLPSTAGEVAVNQSLADRGATLGETLRTDDAEFTVVGVAEHPSARATPYVFAWAGPGMSAVTNAGSPDWLVQTAGGISWPEVRKLNAAGVTVLSRSVLANPPSVNDLPPDVVWEDGSPQHLVAVVALIVVMALLEVVLLAGPAFAVSARRMQHSLALMTASGGTPRQSRQAVLATAWVLGSVAAALGVVVGIAGAKIATVVGQRWYPQWFAPLDVPWWHVAVIAAFGLLSAVLAALVPAWIAARQDVVAVLAGRRGDPPAKGRGPVLGAVVVGAGIALAATGAKRSSGGEFLVAASAVVLVLGVILLVPMALTVLGRVAARLPLSLRYAVRDSTRTRSRTAPAVMAVAASVMAVVALSISLGSDEKENEATYTPSLRMGDGMVSWFDLSAKDVKRVEAVLREQVPDRTVTALRGLENESSWAYVSPEGSQDEASLLQQYGSWGTPLLVRDDLPDLVDGLDESGRTAATRALARGSMVVFTDADREVERVTLEFGTMDETSGDQSERGATFPAHVVQVPRGQAGSAGIIGTKAASELGLDVVPVGFHVDAGLSRADAADLEERLASISDNIAVEVERGYQRDAAGKIVIAALVAVGALLMVGGTLTATFLSLSDAQPDLRTLASVGAAPKIRRRVAAGYALVIGGVGTVLGVLMGLVPGIAISFPLTNQAVYENVVGPQYYLAVPWLLIGALVIGLPLFTALVVGLTTRSRLPLLARQD